MKKLSQSFFIQAFAFASLFLMPFTSYINGTLWMLCAAVFIGLAIWFMLVAEEAKKELAVPDGRFQPAYKKFGFGTAVTLLVAVFGGGLVFLVISMIEMAKALSGSGSSDTIMSLINFFRDNYAFFYYIVFALLAAGLIFMLVSEYRTVRHIKELAGGQYKGFGKLRIFWFISAAVRLIGVGFFAYVENWILIQHRVLPGDYWRILLLFGAVTALLTLFSSMVMRTDEYLAIRELEDDADDADEDDGDLLIESFLPAEDDGAE